MSAYTDALLDFRRRKDEHFAAGQGPLKDEALAQFSGLSYFAPDEAWVFDLPLEVAPDQQREFELETNQGTSRFMSQLGYITLFFGSGERRLSVFGPLGEEQPARVFIPFKDATSGKLTYGAGRYLDAPVTYSGGAASIHLDFNLAYHPYCAYGEGWTCPLPPPENVLPEEVMVGEKLPAKNPI